MSICHVCLPAMPTGHVFLSATTVLGHVHLLGYVILSHVHLLVTLVSRSRSYISVGHVCQSGTSVCHVYLSFMPVFQSRSLLVTSITLSCLSVGLPASRSRMSVGHVCLFRSCLERWNCRYFLLLLLFSTCRVQCF